MKGGLLLYVIKEGMKQERLAALECRDPSYHESFSVGLNKGLGVGPGRRTLYHVGSLVCNG